MTPCSILYPPEGAAPTEATSPPECFKDLNLDQIVTGVTAAKSEYNLTPFFYEGPCRLETVRYRQEVFRDLETPGIEETIKAFERGMKSVRQKLCEAEKRHYRLQRQAWFLKAASQYCSTVHDLADGLKRARPSSRGLLALQAAWERYQSSAEFQRLWTEASLIEQGLTDLRYSFVIERTTVRIRRPGNEPDLSEEVGKTFQKFRQGAVKDHLLDFTHSPDMNHVEAAILDRVALLYPELFGRLGAFQQEFATFADPLVTTLDREAQFYVAYRDYLRPLQDLGLPFCYATLTSRADQIVQRSGFDLALARQKADQGVTVVTNDYSLLPPERLMIVSGPNQGGKTTFARAFGQSHYLASLGCPVPGIEARLATFDQIFTHFEAEEELRKLHGKLYDDLVRFQHILATATSDSIVIMNEIFNSTTLRDAEILARRVLNWVCNRGAWGVCVTFLDEMASLNEKTVSMVGTIVPENPAERTFKILRRPADGLAYALSIVEKHQLSYHQILKRVPS